MVSINTFILLAVLQIILLLQVVLYQLFLGSIGVEDAAESLVAVVLLTLGCRFCLSDEFLGVGRELLLQQVDTVRFGYVH